MATFQSLTYLFGTETALPISIIHHHYFIFFQFFKPFMFGGKSCKFGTVADDSLTVWIDHLHKTAVSVIYVSVWHLKRTWYRPY